jgi:outer membrane protein assembly factor BamD (BamD/ComL family)
MSNQKHPSHNQAGPPVNEEWIALQEAIRNHIGTALTLVLVALVAVTAIWMLQQRRQQNVLEASQILASARVTSEFEDILHRFPKSDAAPLAQLHLAKLHYDMGRYADALASYETFLQNWGSHPLADTALLGRLFAIEALGGEDRIRDAAEGFRAFAEANPDNFLYPQARMGEARCKQLLGMLDEATEIYTAFTETFPDSPWTPQAEERLVELQRRRPSSEPVSP